MTALGGVNCCLVLAAEAATLAYEVGVVGVGLDCGGLVLPLLPFPFRVTVCDERSSSRVDTLLTNHFPRHVTVTT